MSLLQNRTDQRLLGRFFLDHGRHPMIRSGGTLSEPDSSLFLEDRNVANKEKKIDTGIVSAMVKDAHGIGSRRHLRYRHERFPNRGSHLRTAAITERIERSHN